MLDPALIWTDSDAIENLKSYANDFWKDRKDEVLLQYYCETAKVKSRAVWYVYLILI